MSSIGSAIYAATRDEEGIPGVNLLAWDWAEQANPNGCCDIAHWSSLPNDVQDAFLAAWKAPTFQTIKDAFRANLDQTVCFVGTLFLLNDAIVSAERAGKEGIRLGVKLADVIRNQGPLGSELHLIGKSHGGGVLGAAAKHLAEKGIIVDSLTTLDTPKVGCIPTTDTCYVNSLQFVDPAAASRTAVIYYQDLTRFGFGKPIRVRDRVTNLSLNSVWASGFRHLWIAGNDDCGCPPPWLPDACRPDEGWYPVSLWDVGSNPVAPKPLYFQDSIPSQKTVLEVTEFPTGVWLEGDRNVFAPTGACCVPQIILFGASTCTQVTQDECGPSGVFLGDGTVCLGGLIDPACNPESATAGGIVLSDAGVSGMSLIRNEPFDTANSWSGNLAQLVVGADPFDAINRVILLEEQGDAWFFKDIDWPEDATELTFDYMFGGPLGRETLTVYLDDEIVYYDNADISLATGGLTSSGAIYVGEVAGTTARLNLVLRTDEPDGGEFGGSLIIDNIRVFGFRAGDADLDGDRDLFDYNVLQRCAGRGIGEDDELPPECWAFDLDETPGVDLDDAAIFVDIIGDEEIGGPSVIPVP
jgi:hypothetical protein